MQERRPPWRRLPTGRQAINWRTPLARGLVRLVVWRGGDAVDLVTGETLAAVGSGLSEAITPQGQGGANSNESSYWQLPITTEGQRSLTMGWVGMHTGGSTPITVRDSSISSGTILFWRGPAWRMRIGGSNGATDYASAGTFATGVLYAAAAASGETSAELWVDGLRVLGGSNAGIAGDLISPWVIHHNGANPGQGPLASSLLLAVWDQAKTADDLRAWTLDPWQLFEAPRIQVPAASGPMPGSHDAAGALVATNATLSGVAARSGTHATSGALAAVAASVSGTAGRTRLHAATGALSSTAAGLAGTAARTRLHAASGALQASASQVAAVAARTTVAPSKEASGAMQAAASVVAGAAARVGTRTAIGALLAGPAIVLGAAARSRLRVASGAMVADAAGISGEAGFGVLMARYGSLEGSRQHAHPARARNVQTGARTANIQDARR